MVEVCSRVHEGPGSLPITAKVVISFLVDPAIYRLVRLCVYPDKIDLEGLIILTAKVHYFANAHLNLFDIASAVQVDRPPIHQSGHSLLPPMLLALQLPLFIKT